jgi:prophage tail gpP-like protein
MARTYTVRPGDTFETVARQVYGDQVHATRISSANPEGITAGAVLIIPDLPVSQPAPAIPANTPDEVAIVLAGRRFRFWTAVSIDRRIDGISAVTVSAPWEPNSPEMREFFRPFSYPDVEIYVGGRRLFTGTGVSPSPGVSAEGRVVSWTAYSKPGVLQDCTLPPTAPTEFNGQGLKEIAETIGATHGIAIKTPQDVGAVFDVVAVEPGVTSWQFLSKLAKQRGFILTDDEEGALVILKAGDDGDSVGFLQEGAEGLVSISPGFNGQAFYSSVTAVSENTYLNPGGSYTAKNPRTDSNRPRVIRSPDADGATVQSAAESALGRMFSDAVIYSATVPDWTAPKGERWAPGQLVDVEAPGAMIYERYTLQVLAVSLTRNDAQTSTGLTLILPGALSGVVPEAMPWDE